jgi:predicted negative regulator of RcsB-dependent stress response
LNRSFLKVEFKRIFITVSKELALKNILILALLIFAGWKLYEDNIVKVSNTEQSQPIQQVTKITQSTIDEATKTTLEQQNFECDGREYCPQMSSCAEATYFIQNCPNTKMDGDSDGVPCERQWCR